MAEVGGWQAKIYVVDFNVLDSMVLYQLPPMEMARLACKKGTLTEAAPARII